MDPPALFDGENMMLGAKRPTIQDTLALIEMRPATKGVPVPSDDEAIPAFLDAFRYLQTDPDSREKIIRALITALDAKKPTPKALRSLKFLSLLVVNSRMVAKQALLANLKKTMAEGKLKSAWLYEMRLDRYLDTKHSTEEALEYACAIANAFADDIDITLFIKDTHRIPVRNGRLEYHS